MAYKKPYRKYSSRQNNASFPTFKIVCETENHYGYINLKPKEEYQNNTGYAEIDKELFRITGNRLSSVQITDRNDCSRYVYSRPENLPLSPDMGWDTVVTLAANNTRKIMILFTNFPDSIPYSQIKKNLGEFAARYFTDLAGQPLTICGAEIDGSVYLEKELQKKPHHRSYNMPHSEAMGSPIEQLFKAELTRRDISFEEQVHIRRDGSVFTIPDFVIASAKLMIYCDGIEFHLDKQRIIMDKQQDRFLQAQGYNVFRFSGSEITAHVDRCVNEVVNFIALKKQTPGR